MDIDQLWDFDRPADSESRFRTALADADGEPAAVLRTQLARALGLQRRFDEAAAELDRLPADASPLVRTYAALERGRVLRSGGNSDGAKQYFRTALDLATRAGLDHLAADAAHMMAITVGGEEQIPWAQRALEIAEWSTDPRARKWIASVTHNLGWTMHDLGRYEEALQLWERALAAREERGEPEQVRIARWTVARGLRSIGRYEEALAIQRSLAAEGPSDGYVDEEIGELLLALGRGEEAAAPHFARAYRLLSADSWLAEAEPQRLARLAQLGG